MGCGPVNLHRPTWNFQSVMDSPDLVRRVMPPSTTMLYTHRHPTVSRASQT
jgi:hypothetical protein